MVLVTARCVGACLDGSCARADCMLCWVSGLAGRWDVHIRRLLCMVDELDDLFLGLADMSNPYSCRGHLFCAVCFSTARITSNGSRPHPSNLAN